MARPLRIEFSGAFYHVTSRGNEKKEIFKNLFDRRKFLSYLESAAERYHAVIHAYCLMDNHFHLMLETPEGNLSQIMHHINTSYTAYFNKKHDRTGHLLQGRYKAILVEADTYAAELSRYIHLNPVRAGMTELPEEHPWSSCRFYLEGSGPAWLTTDFILCYFGERSEAARSEYRKYLHQLLGKSYDNPLSYCIGSTVLGSEDFLNHVKQNQAKTVETDRELPALRHFKTRPEPERIREIAMSEFAHDRKLARSAGIFLTHRYSRAKLKEIGKMFNLSESGVTQASRRFQKVMEADERLKKKIDQILNRFILSNV